MYLAQVEHCWLNDYVTVSASVSAVVNCYLPLLPSMKLRSPSIS